MDRGLLLYVREDSPSKTWIEVYWYVREDSPSKIGGGLLLYVREEEVYSPSKTWIEVYGEERIEVYCYM